MTFEELIKKYANKYGQEWVQGDYPQTRIDKIRAAIEAKDLETLRPIIFGDNGFSREVFKALTGVKLGKTQKARWAALCEFVGADVVKQYEDRLAQAKAEHQARRANRRVLDYLDSMKYVTTRYNGQTMSMYEWYIALKKEGFTKLIEVTQNRAVPIYELRRETDGSYYVFRRKIECEALQYLLEN